jgi:hypothetical protein
MRFLPQRWHCLGILRIARRFLLKLSVLLRIHLLIRQRKIVGQA